MTHQAADMNDSARTLGAFYDVESGDPRSELVDRSALTPEKVAQVNRLMNSLGDLREAENALSEASRRYMKLNSTDMRAIHFLIVCANRHEIATPGMLARHLAISTASTTKLLDRLEAGGHVHRAPHPTDRRALTISVTEPTHRAAVETVGRQHASRFTAAARLSSADLEVVIGFIRDMAENLSLKNAPWAAGLEPEPHLGDDERPHHGRA